MPSEIDLNRDNAAALYASSIERERAARQTMESLPPGSPERIRAWQEWSEAIVRTNRAWRCLRDSNAASSQPQTASAQPRPRRSEHPHAGA